MSADHGQLTALAIERLTRWETMRTQRLAMEDIHRRPSWSCADRVSAICSARSAAASATRPARLMASLIASSGSTASTPMSGVWNANDLVVGLELVLGPRT